MKLHLAKSANLVEHPVRIRPFPARKVESDANRIDGPSKKSL